MNTFKTLNVGDGVTIQHWSDRSPATIIGISPNGFKITLQMDKSTRIDNNHISDMQEYLIEPDSNGSIVVATLRKDGKYRVLKSSELVSIGVRNKFYDYCF